MCFWLLTCERKTKSVDGGVFCSSQGDGGDMCRPDVLPGQTSNGDFQVTFFVNNLRDDCFIVYTAHVSVHTMLSTVSQEVC